jgi:multidrug transporter EmrE-like cation transporter
LYFGLKVDLADDSRYSRGCPVQEVEHRKPRADCRRAGRMSWVSFFLILFSVSLNALAQIFLRKAAVGLGGEALALDRLVSTATALAINPFLLLGMFCYAISIAIWIAVLARVEVSVAYPFLSIGYVIVVFAGLVFLGEDVTLLRVVGVTLICAGLVCIFQSA